MESQINSNTKTNSNNSFEAILAEKLNALSQVSEGLSGLRYSVSKTEGVFSGVLLVDTPEGKFFATAMSKSIGEVTKSLVTQISRQAKMLHVGGVEVLRAI